MKKANYDRTNSTCFHLHGVYLGVKLIKRQESRKEVAQRLGEGRNGELLFNKYRVAFGKMEQF